MQAIAIEQDAAELANTRNAEVISVAFKRASIGCPNCNFPKNVGEFRSLLWTYTELKIRLHRANRVSHWPYHRWGSVSVRRDCKEAFELEAEANRTRHYLRSIWPCQDCIEQFNPTGKKKYPNFNIPQGKDFIE